LLISDTRHEGNFDEETGSPDGEVGPPRVETIPLRYNDQTVLTFNVPPGGTDQANFQLKSP
jgi:hypothetical protein